MIYRGITFDITVHAAGYLAVSEEIITDGSDLDDVIHNIKEAVDFTLEDALTH